MNCVNVEHVHEHHGASFEYSTSSSKPYALSPMWMSSPSMGGVGKGGWGGGKDYARRRASMVAALEAPSLQPLSKRVSELGSRGNFLAELSQAICKKG